MLNDCLHDETIFSMGKMKNIFMFTILNLFIEKNKTKNFEIS